MTERWFGFVLGLMAGLLLFVAISTVESMLHEQAPITIHKDGTWECTTSRVTNPVRDTSCRFPTPATTQPG